MWGKIGLEEHFAIPETLDNSRGFFPDHIWGELKARLLDLHDNRLRLMDEHGIEMMLLSLNAPVVQAIPDPARANDVARKANDYLAREIQKRPGRFQGLAALPMQDPDMAIRELDRCDPRSRLQGRAGQRLLAGRRCRHRRLLRHAAIPAVLERARTARRAVLSAPAQSAQTRRPHLCGRGVAARAVLGLRPGDGGARAAADGIGPVRRAPEAFDRARPHGRGAAVQHVAGRQLQRLGRGPAQLSGQAQDRRLFLREFLHHHRRATSAPRR